MRIITWNVFIKNIRAKKLIQYALDQKPDILCLQEVPPKALRYLTTLPDYHMSYTYDFLCTNNEKSAYLCTLSKTLPAQTKKITYYNRQERSLLNHFYQKILRNQEKHNAIATTIKKHNKAYTIINARLSCAVGSRNRLEQFQHILDNFPKGSAPIICGDLNIVDGRLLNWTTGWLRGFRLADYRLNERKAFEALVRKNRLTNVFYRTNTTIFSPLRFQFDHILIDERAHLTHKEVSRRAFGSDHKMLLVDINI